MKQYKSGLLFGTFDPFHYGHLSLIRRARELCDKLYICIDSNDLIRSKGREPVVNIKDKLDDMSILADYVGVESYQFPKKYYIDLLKPEVLIKGDDWVGKNWEGEQYCKTIYIPHTKGIHSTNIYGLGIPKN